MSRGPLQVSSLASAVWRAHALTTADSRRVFRSEPNLHQVLVHSLALAATNISLPSCERQQCSRLPDLRFLDSRSLDSRLLNARPLDTRPINQDEFSRLTSDASYGSP